MAFHNPFIKYRHVFLDEIDDDLIVFRFVREGASRTVLDDRTIFSPEECGISGTMFQIVQWTVAEHAVEFFRIQTLMAGKIFTMLIAEKSIIIFHIHSLLSIWARWLCRHDPGIPAADRIGAVLLLLSWKVFCRLPDLLPGRLLS